MDDPLDRFEQADAIFAKALELSTEERASFLARACAGDSQLLGIVTRLLQSVDKTEGRLAPGGALRTSEWQELAGSEKNEAPVGPGSTLGPYEVVSLLGEGGMGQVFLARDTRLDREVALKVLDEGPGLAGRVERFGREARAASALNHPNIVTIHDIGSDRSVSYIAMEHIDGESLQRRLSSGALDLDTALDIAQQIASGLAAAHAKGIVHRDLKPANVMLTPDGSAKLVDFGLAKMDATAAVHENAPTRTEPLTAEGTIFGTMGYMSPEQARGAALDYRSDLFSFGALLYEMLSGRRAFDQSSAAEVLAAILKETPTPISQIVSGVPVPLEWAVDRCLQKAPEDRYDSTRDLARDLRTVREFRSREASSTVRCGNCQTDNPTGHAFCSQCGGELKRTCGGCGENLPVSASFCGACGHSQEAPRAAPTPAEEPAVASGSQVESPSTAPGSSVMSGERRQATILVTRLVNYESLIELALPEEVELALATVESSVREAVERFGGRVDRSSPEEIVALFGIPTAHEDDARRAAHCALEVQQELRGREGVTDQVQLCAAVHTGPVVVRGMGDAAGSRRVLGEAIQVAVKLAQAAEAGQSLLSPESHRLAGAGFRIEPAPAVRLRGSGDPVVPLRVLGTSDSSVPPLEVSEAPLTAFAGRQGEFGTLVGSVEAARGGEGRFVAVVGDAGAGKSRLFFELRKRLESESVRVVEGRCQPHGERIPYLPLIQACRAILDVHEGDPTELQFGTAVDRLRAIDSQLESLLPLYFHLLSLSNEEFPLPEHLEGKPFRHAMQEALAALFTLASRKQPLVLILEDWHWVDEASHDVVRQLVEMCPSYPLLVVVGYRPEASADWGGTGQVQTIHLGSLGPAASATIMRSVFGADRVPDELVTLIHERTGGNPFFIEEVGRTLAEEGAVRVQEGQASVVGSLQGLQLPESVQAVIRTRLDRIDAPARDLLRRASVVGREFSIGVLRRIVEDDSELDEILSRLKDRGLIRQARVVPEPIYLFQHALTQEVAYDSLLQRQKKELHGRVGDAVEAELNERLEEQYDVLAWHFSEAEDWAKAVRYGQLSARRARDLSQFVDALVTLGNTRSWLERLPEDESTREHWIGLLQEEARVSEIVGDRVRQQRAVDDLLALLKAGEIRPELIAAHLSRAELLALDREFAAAEQEVERAIDVSRRLGDSDFERRSLRTQSFVLWQQERNEEALVPLDEALAIDREIGDGYRIVMDLTNRTSVLRALGRYDEALESIMEAIRYSEEPGANPHRRVESLYVAYTIYRDLGQTETGEPYLRMAMETQREDRFTIHQPFQTSALANILLDRGESEEALELLRDSVGKSRKARYAFGLSQCQQNLAHVLIGLDREDEALPHLLEAAKMFGELRDPESELKMLAAAAPILENNEDLARARHCWTQVSERAPDEIARVDAWRGLARIAETEGQNGRALAHLRSALELSEAPDSVRGDLLNSIGILEWKQGRFAEALDCYRAGLAIFESANETARAGLVLNSIAACLKPMGRHDEAVATLERALELHERAGQDLLRGHALALLGDIALERADAETALTHYRESLAVRQRIGDRRGEGWMRYQLARAFQASEQLERAEENLELAARIAAESEDHELEDACAGLGKR